MNYAGEFSGARQLAYSDGVAEKSWKSFSIKSFSKKKQGKAQRLARISIIGLYETISCAVAQEKPVAKWEGG